MALKALEIKRTTKLTGNGILVVIPNISMAYGHDTLREIALREGYDARALARGQYIMFMNPKATACKLFAAHNWICYYKSEGNHGNLLSPDGLTDLPSFYTRYDLDYEQKVVKWALKYFSTKEIA